MLFSFQIPLLGLCVLLSGTAAAFDVTSRCPASRKKHLQPFCERFSTDEIPAGNTSATSLYFTAHFNEIETCFGRLKGIGLTARNNKTYYAYYGIPYAKAPVGKLRFEPPVAVESWNGTLDATRVHRVCPQISQYGATFEGIEDCLFVDVYTPEDASPGSDIPVVFSIFGGQYKYGTTVRDGVSIFMGREIIIVRVSHRLGALGFLSTGDTVVPGNMGLKDLAMALRWTKENIYDFGGDPNRITLQGHSSGAACAYLMTLSPLSKDNYDRAVLQSGVATTPFMFNNRGFAVELTRALARKVNCPLQSHERMKTCLQDRTPEELVIATQQLAIWGSEPERLFKPTIEDANVVGAFLVSHPQSTPYPSHTKPWIIGMTTGEGLEFVNALEGSRQPALDEEVTLPLVGTYKWAVKLNHLKYLRKIMRTRFIDDKSPNDLAGLVRIFNGITTGLPILEAVQTYRGPKFIYLFDYKGMHKNATEEHIGVRHALDLQLIFARPHAKRLTQEDVMFGEEMVTRWVNFYHSGNPNQPFTINTTIFGAWEPMSSSRVEFLCINRSGTMERDYFANEYSWWKKVPFYKLNFTNL